MSVKTFFARIRWGSRWGVVDRFHPTPHKGLDIVWTAHTSVPVLRSGTIVADLPSASVGRYIVVQVGLADFDVYCHVITRGLKGRVTAGTTLAYLAGPHDKHGTAWTGPHCHLCRSTTRNGWATWGAANRNPEPLVLSVIGTSGANPKPDPVHVDLALLRREKESTMYVRGKSSAAVYNVFTDANGHVRLRACGQAEAAYANAGGLVVPGDDGTLTLLAGETGYRNGVAIPLPNVNASVDVGDITVPPVDLTPVLTAIAGVPAAVIVEQKKPGN